MWPLGRWQGPGFPRSHGILSVQGNKGGVSVRLSIFGHMVCFLNCHLPAHLEKAEQRKEDFATILHMQQFEGRVASGILDHECVPHHFAPQSGLGL